jgi:DNA primase
MNDELLLLIAVAVNYVSPQKERFFPKFRAALEINEIEEPNAKELFIALEECIRYNETGMDELLARISSPDLRKFIVERSSSGEFSLNVEQLVADGIRKITGRRLERRQEEIIIKLRSLKRTGGGRSSEVSGQEVPGLEVCGLEVRELLAEKMRIDNELFLMKQGR